MQPSHHTRAVTGRACPIGRGELIPIAVHPRTTIQIVFLLSLLVGLIAWSSPGLAQLPRQQIVAGTTQMNAAGSTFGVDMSGAATLDVGGPAPGPSDIFTNNIALTSPTPAVTTSAASTGNVVFFGTSNVYGAIGTPAQFLLSVAGGATAGSAVNFYGPVYTTTTYVNGAGTLNFLSPGTSLSTGGLIYQGDGTVNLAPGTNLNAVGGVTTAAGTNTGTLVLGSGSVLTGAVGAASAALRNITVAGGNNTSGVTGTIVGAVNAYTFSLGTNTLLVNGALNIGDSTINGVVNTILASSTVYGNIRPLGFTSLGTSLRVNVTVPSTAYFPVGTQFNIVQTQAGTAQSGTANSQVLVTVQDPTNPLYTFLEVPLTGTQAGLVAIITTGIPVQVAVSPLVPALLATPLTPDLTSVLAAINALTNPAAVNNAVAQLAPSAPDLAAPLVTFQATRQFQDLIQSHLDDALCGQVSHADPDARADTAVCRWDDPHAGWWLKGFGYFGSQGDQNGYTGYNTDIAGTMLGYDMPLLNTPFGGKTRVGLAIGYAYSAINGNTFGANTDVNTYQATAYIGHEDGPWFLYGDVSFGWNDYTGSRPISFPGVNRVAQASYDGQDYTGYITTGYHFYAGGFTITPLASLQYTHEDLAAYGETGAGDIDLSVKSQSYDFLESGLGTKVERAFTSAEGTYVPEAHFKWLHELANPTVQNTAAFSVPGALPFTTTGLRTAADTLNPGVGLTFLSCACTGKTWSLEAVYDYYWRPDAYSAHQIMVRFTARF